MPVVAPTLLILGFYTFPPLTGPSAGIY